MKNLIDYSFFTGALYLPLSKDFEIENLNDFISIFQQKYLIDLLGYSLYKELDAALLELSTPDKWLNLLEGDYYTNSNGIVFYFPGVQVMLSYFIYYEIKMSTAKAPVKVETYTTNNNALPDLSLISRNAAFAYNTGISYYGFDFISPGAFHSNLDTPESAFNYLYFKLIETPGIFQNWVFKRKQYKATI